MQVNLHKTCTKDFIIQNNKYTEHNMYYYLRLQKYCSTLGRVSDSIVPLTFPESGSQRLCPPYWGVAGGIIIPWDDADDTPSWASYPLCAFGELPLHSLYLYLVASSQTYVQFDHSVHVDHVASATKKNKAKSYDNSTLFQFISYLLDSISNLPCKLYLEKDPPHLGIDMLHLVVDK